MNDSVPLFKIFFGADDDTRDILLTGKRDDLVVDDFDDLK